MMTLLSMLLGFLTVISVYEISMFVIFDLPDILDDMKFKKGYEERTIIREDMYVGDGKWTTEMNHYARCKFKITEFKNKTNYPNWTHKRQEIIEQGEWIPIKKFKTDGLIQTSYGTK